MSHEEVCTPDSRGRLSHDPDHTFTYSTLLENAIFSFSLTTMARLSGLQREVLKLYRSCMRAVRTKPVENQEHWRLYVREEFGKHRKLPKKSFSVIEHLLRVGHRRYEMYSNPNIKDIH